MPFAYFETGRAGLAGASIPALQRRPETGGPVRYATDDLVPNQPETLGGKRKTAIKEVANRITAHDTQAYFAEVAEDYRAWSPGYNMHFGFWKWGANPFRREGMLVEMNRVVGRALRVDANAPACVVDLGCGAGATAHTLATERAALHVVAVSNVAVQHRIGKTLDARAGVTDRIAHLQGDFNRTGLPAAQADGVYAVESACYATGAEKRDFIAEVARLLKPAHGWWWPRLFDQEGTRPGRRLAASALGRQLGRADIGAA